MGTYRVRHSGDQNVLAKKMKAMNVEGFNNSNLFDMDDTTFNRADYRARKAQARQMMPGWTRRQVKAYALSNLPGYALDAIKSVAPQNYYNWQQAGDSAIEQLQLQDDMQRRDRISDLLTSTATNLGKLEHIDTTPYWKPAVIPVFDEEIPSVDIWPIQIQSSTSSVNRPKPDLSDEETANILKRVGSKAPKLAEIRQAGKWREAADWLSQLMHGQLDNLIPRKLGESNVDVYNDLHANSVGNFDEIYRIVETGDVANWNKIPSSYRDLLARRFTYVPRFKPKNRPTYNDVVDSPLRTSANDTVDIPTLSSIQRN